MVVFPGYWVPDRAEEKLHVAFRHCRSRCDIGCDVSQGQTEVQRGKNKMLSWKEEIKTT